MRSREEEGMRMDQQDNNLEQKNEDQKNYINQPNRALPPQTGDSKYYPKNKKSSPWIWVIVAVSVVAVMGLGILLTNRSIDQVDPIYFNEPHIACIYIEGTIVSESSSEYDHQYLMATLDQLIEDEKNKGLLVYLDTPGGELLPSAELADKIIEYKEMTGNPVIVYGHNMMASGGYWIACAADWIVINRYGITGGIGVTYGTMIDVSGFLTKNGIKTNTITSGDQKAMGSMFEPMSAETTAIFQGIIDEYYGYFLDWIILERDFERGELIALADGRIYTTSQALEHGLIDQVGTYQDAIVAMDEQLSDQYPVYDYLPPEELSVWDQFNWLEYLLQGRSQTDLILEMLPPSGPLAYYEGE